jgi:tetratricopeptide (TPR) repeat protein
MELHEQSYDEDRDMQEWQALYGSAVDRKHAGDIDGAIDAMLKCVSLTRTKADFVETTALNLNYLADLYLIKNASDQAEAALQESIELSRCRFPQLLAANLRILGRLQSGKGNYQQALASAQESLRVSEEHGHAHGVLGAQELIRTIVAIQGGEKEKSKGDIQG